MRWLLDAQLPRRIAYLLRSEGHDALHTLDLASGNASPDALLTSLADREGRVVVTKDADFVDGFWIQGAPRRLLLISTGNIRNDAPEGLLKVHLAALEDAFDAARFVELTRTALVVHE